jgi:hypothetical protein
MKMGNYYQSQNKQGKTKGCTLAKPPVISIIGANKLKTGCYGGPSIPSRFTFKHKEKPPKAVRNQVNKLAYRAANIGSMLVK